MEKATFSEVKPVGKERFAMLTIVLVLVRTIVAIMVQLVGQDCNLALVHVTSLQFDYV